MMTTELCDLIDDLISLPQENEWVEFKASYNDLGTIGETISALSNGASLRNQANGYLVFGVNNDTQDIVGTKFHPKSAKKGNEEAEQWLIQRLNSRIDFKVYEFKYNDKNMALFEIPASTKQPTRFLNKAYIRIGSNVRELNEFPEKEKSLWLKSSKKTFEKRTCLSNCTADDVIRLLDCQAYFDLIKRPFPATRERCFRKTKK